jgi:hypothetical protein
VRLCAAQELAEEIQFKDKAARLQLFALPHNLANSL